MNTPDFAAEALRIRENFCSHPCPQPEPHYEPGFTCPECVDDPMTNQIARSLCEAFVDGLTRERAAIVSWCETEAAQVESRPSLNATVRANTIRNIAFAVRNRAHNTIPELEETEP